MNNTTRKPKVKLSGREVMGELLTDARHIDGKEWPTFGRVFVTNKGQLFINKRKYAKKYGWPLATMRRFFDTLDRNGYITQKSYHGIGTLITFLDLKIIQAIHNSSYVSSQSAPKYYRKNIDEWLKK